GGLGDQPAGGVGRYAVDRPADRGREQRLLDGVLAVVEVAVTAHEHTKDAGSELAQQVGNGRMDGAHMSLSLRSSTGRTSTSPEMASGTRVAIARARSSASQSTRKKPARCSFASANGPSLIIVWSPATVTRFARAGSASPSDATSSPASASSAMSAR